MANQFDPTKGYVVPKGMTINELIRVRRKGMRSLKGAAKALDTQVEVLQRKIDAVLERKTKVPTRYDISQIDEYRKGVEAMTKHFLNVEKDVIGSWDI